MKVIFVLFLIFSLLFSSCSNSQTLDISFSNDETLMAISEEKNKNCLWTNQLEEYRLSRKIESVRGIDSKVSLSVELMSLKNSHKVYPVIEDFGFLDNSICSEEMLLAIEKFIDNVCQWNIESIDIQNDSNLIVMLFANDVQKNWKKEFGVDFPSEDKRKFLKGIYARPHIDGDSAVVPFRFSNKKSFLDILVTFESQKCLISNIQIIKWGRE